MNISGSSFLFKAYILSNENAISNISLLSSYYSPGSGDNYESIDISVTSGLYGSNKQVAITDIGNSLSGIMTASPNFIFPKSTNFSLQKNSYNFISSNSWTGYYTGYQANNINTGYLSVYDAGLILNLNNQNSNEYYKLNTTSNVTGSGYYKNKINILSVNKQTPTSYLTTNYIDSGWAKYSTVHQSGFAMLNSRKNVCGYAIEFVTNMFFTGSLTDVYTSVTTNSNPSGAPFITNIYYSYPQYNGGISSGDSFTDFYNSLAGLSNSVSGVIYFNNFQNNDKVVFDLYPYDYESSFIDYNTGTTINFPQGPTYPKTGFILSYGTDFIDCDSLCNALKSHLDVPVNYPVWYRYPDLKGTYEARKYITGALMKIQKLDNNSIYFQSYRSMPDIFSLSLDLQPRTSTSTTITGVSSSGLSNIGYNFLVPNKILLEGKHDSIARSWSGIDVRYNLAGKINNYDATQADIKQNVTTISAGSDLSILNELFPDIYISPAFSGEFYKNSGSGDINIITNSYRLGFKIDPNSYLYGTNFSNYTGFFNSTGQFDANLISQLSFNEYRLSFFNFIQPAQLRGLQNNQGFYVKNITLYSCTTGDMLLDKTISPLESTYYVDVYDNIKYNINGNFNYNFNLGDSGILNLNDNDYPVIYDITGNNKNINFRNTTGIIPQNKVTGYVVGAFPSTGLISQMISGYFYNPQTSEITLRNLLTGYTDSGFAVLQKDLNVISQNAINNSSALQYGKILNTPIYMDIISSGIFYKTQNNFVYKSDLLTGYSYYSGQFTGGPSSGGYYQYDSNGTGRNNTGVLYTGTTAFFYGNNFSISGNNILPAIRTGKIWYYNFSTKIPAVQFVTGLSSALVTGLVTVYSGIRTFTGIWDISTGSFNSKLSFQKNGLYSPSITGYYNNIPTGFGSASQSITVMQISYNNSLAVPYTNNLDVVNLTITGTGLSRYGSGFSIQITGGVIP